MWRKAKVTVVIIEGSRTDNFDHVQAELLNDGTPGNRQNLYFEVWKGEGEHRRLIFGTGVVNLRGTVADFSRRMTLKPTCSDGGTHNLADFGQLRTAHSGRYHLQACTNCGGVLVH